MVAGRGGPWTHQRHPPSGFPRGGPHGATLLADPCAAPPVRAADPRGPTRRGATGRARVGAPAVGTQSRWTASRGHSGCSSTPFSARLRAVSARLRAVSARLRAVSARLRAAPLTRGAVCAHALVPAPVNADRRRCPAWCPWSRPPRATSRADRCRDRPLDACQRQPGRSSTSNPPSRAGTPRPTRPRVRYLTPSNAAPVVADPAARCGAGTGWHCGHCFVHRRLIAPSPLPPNAPYSRAARRARVAAACRQPLPRHDGATSRGAFCADQRRVTRPVSVSARWDRLCGRRATAIISAKNGL